MQEFHSRQLLHERGICCVIPVYNNAGTIADVVKRTLRQCDDVIVVNDGSTDGTAEILRGLDGITLVDYNDNAGKGTALKRGFRQALDMGFAYAITLDADGQHYPEDIPTLLKANMASPGALIVGSRKLDGVVRSKGSSFANKFSNFWFCVQTLHRIPDTQTGYRLYPLHKLHGLNIMTSRYEAELELLVFASWHGVKIVPIEVNVYYPAPEERVSHFRPGPDFARISVLNTCLCFMAIIYGLPLGVARIAYTLFMTLYSLMVYLSGAICVIYPFALIYTTYCKIKGRSGDKLNALFHWLGKNITKQLGWLGKGATIDNPHRTDIEKPCIFICNHQSHLDLMINLALKRKLVFLTNDWVWKSPFFGYAIRHAHYYPVSMGMEELTPRLRKLVEKGYSITVFPEGTRSKDCSIGRFHKGAFHLAEQLNLDIIPLVEYGLGKMLPKKALYMRRWALHLEIGRRFTPEEQKKISPELRERAKWFRKLIKNRYQEICNKFDKDA